MRERKEKMMEGEAWMKDGGSKNRGHPIGYADGGRKTQRRDRAVFKLCPFFGINILLMFDIYI